MAFLSFARCAIFWLKNVPAMITGDRARNTSIVLLLGSRKNMTPTRMSGESRAIQGNGSGSSSRGTSGATTFSPG